nr:perlucin-like isoform X1 [Cherax quadricarinatus]XP_053642994.1 perlucin-like isoform X2 [Cherax quadricarinatus]
MKNTLIYSDPADPWGWVCGCGRVCGGEVRPVEECGRRRLFLKRCGGEERLEMTSVRAERLTERWRGAWAWKVLWVAMVVLSLASVVLAKKNVSSNTSPLQNQLRSKCPMAFHEIGNKCYFYGYFPLNWFRAAEFCHSFGNGVSLATIETSQENLSIRKWLAVNGNHNTGVWVGGSDNGHSGKWAWFPTGQLVDFSNWGPSQPSGGDQHCMYLVGGLLGYQWADFHCDFDMHFLCEYSVNTVKPWR